jgi:hypothetical protein
VQVGETTMLDLDDAANGTGRAVTAWTLEFVQVSLEWLALRCRRRLRDVAACG